MISPPSFEKRTGVDVEGASVDTDAGGDGAPAARALRPALARGRPAVGAQRAHDRGAVEPGPPRRVREAARRT